MENENEPGIGFKGEAGELYMLDKKERVLLRAIMGITLKSSAGRELIVQKHGKESLELAETLLKQMGGSLEEE